MTSIFGDSIDQAQLHRETYITVMNGALRKRGSKKNLAEKLGITPQYLSCLLERWGTQLPGEDLAPRLVAALPLPSAQQQQVLYHIEHARSQREQACMQCHETVRNHSPRRILRTLGSLQRQATLIPDSRTAKSYYQQLSEQSRLLLQAFNPEHDPMFYVDICVLNHDVALVLDRPIDALWHIKKARAVMDSRLYDDFSSNKLRYMDQHINVLRIEGVVYHNLHLPNQAYACYERANDMLTSTPFQATKTFWMPHLCWDTINTIAEQPRFAITEAELIAKRGLRCLDDASVHADLVKPLFRLLTHNALANAYISYGGKRNEKKAMRMLDTELKHMEKLEAIGPLHQVLLLNTYARLHWKRGDKEMWEHFIQQALRIALDANLTHQLHEMKTTYGQALEPLLQSAQHL